MARLAPALALLGYPAATRAEQLSTKTGPVNVESLVKLDNPSGMSFLPDGRLLITEKPGRLRIYADGKLSTPINGLPKIQYHGQGERADPGGLLDVEIDPDGGRLVFSPDGKLFITSGDRQRFEPAQDLGSNLGKVVRINPDGPQGQSIRDQARRVAGHLDLGAP